MLVESFQAEDLEGLIEERILRCLGNESVVGRDACEKSFPERIIKLQGNELC